MMAYDINKKLQETKKKHRRRGIWQKVVGALCCVVVFCVAYALILPVVTLTSEQKLDCRCEVHQHEENCFDADGNVICGYADYAVHTHDPDYCYDSEGNLVCPLKEIKVHEHDASCYEEQSVLVCEETESGGHEHDESCYETRTVLTCEEPEIILHTHSESCYEDVPDDEGNVAGRKLICGKLQVEEHRHTEECLADAEAEKGITLTSAEDNTATPEGGFNGYVNGMVIKSTQTGSEPFDGNDDAGNDSSATNDIVRTFDTISYDVEAAFAQRSNDALIEQNSELNFEISMDKKITEARFDISTMPWLDTGSATWEIDYWAKNPDTEEEYIVLVERKDGDGTKLYRKDDNGLFTIETSINAMVLGSNPDEGVPYQTSTGGIIRQTLTGKLNVLADAPKASGTQSFSTGIRVRNAKHNDTFTPSFKAWFTKNKSNYGLITTEGTSTEFSGNQVEANPVKVSCAPLYNLALEESTEYVNYLSWYDFSSGDEVTDANLLAYLKAAGRLTENYGKADPSQYTQTSDSAIADMYDALSPEQKSNLANIRYGRMNALGITASLASEATPHDNNKGYKGCSLPVGDITFDLSLNVEPKVTAGANVDISGYSAILWDYRPNVAGNYTVTYPEAGKTREWNDPSKGDMGRNLRWRGIDFSQYGTRMAPAAYRGTEGQVDTTVYDSGLWKLTQINGTDASQSAATNANSVYTFTVSDYDFDLDNYLYPDRYYGASDPDGKLRVTDFAFFGGFAQVLYVMPYANSGTVDVSRELTLGNLEATNLSEQKLNENITHGENVSAAGEVNTNDNTVTSAITQYSVGDFTKRSSFNTADSWNHTEKEGGGKSFLGTSFWGSPQWDENIYAGSDISIMGSVQLSTTSDNTVRAVNLLQLFDSEALSITPKADVTGEYITQNNVNFGNFYENTYPGHTPEVTYLFAADPDYADGYNTNADGVVTYMNTVREQDLVYADRLYWNETEQRYNIVKYDVDGDGDLEELTCIGVLSEVRNCNYIDYCYVRVPITVADSAEFVSETVCTVNAAEAWIDAGAMGGVSWKNGVWDPLTGKNTLSDYVDITYAWTAGGNGYFCYNNADSFSKVEYNENGGYQSGTAGKMNGASLLILGYKAKVNIDNRKHIDTTYSNYAPADGETSVTWVVKDIETEVGTTQGTTAASTTSLTIPVNLEYDGDVEAQQQDLFYITANSSTITEQLWETNPDGSLRLDDDGNPIPVYETDDEGNQILDANGNPIQKTVVKSVSTDPDSPTTITFKGTYYEQVGDSLVEKYTLYSYTIYAQRNSARTGVTYYIDGAPVGQPLPDISFKMNLGNSLVNNNHITATAAISGSGDKRAYSEAAGNQRSNTIGISKIGGSDLAKTVDIAYGEINASMKYTVTFTNTSLESLPKAYFYDNLPYNNDGRGSAYDMGEDGTATDGTIVKEISFRSVTGTELTNDFQATVTVYYPRGGTDNTYSKMSDIDFRNLMYGFTDYVNSDGTAVQEEGNAGKSKLDALLDDSQSFNVLMTLVGVFYEDSNGPYYKLNANHEGYDAVEYNGEYYTKIVPSNDNAADYASTTTRYKRTASYHRTLAVNAGMVVYEGETEVWQTRTEENAWEVEGKKYTNGKDAYEAFLSTIPGVVVKVENMGPSRSIEMNIQFDTNNNKAGDVYSNDAWQWTVGSTPLHSNTVQTEIVGRTISGRVWVDENLNGVYDVGEKLINGVNCTLFKWDDTQQKYVPCTEDVAGRPIGTVTTGSYIYHYNRPVEESAVENEVEAYLNTVNGGSFYRDSHGHEVTLTDDEIGARKSDGQYSFDALPEGKYIVAFSGGDLDKYGGATSYQINLGNDGVSNDGVALFDTKDSNLDTVVSELQGITGENSPYKYAIAYDLTGNNTVENVKLHSIADIMNNNIGLTNSVELYDHQDLGLVQYAGFEFPETGGAGTVMFTISGLILTPGAGIFLIVRRRRNAGENR